MESVNLRVYLVQKLQIPYLISAGRIVRLFTIIIGNKIAGKDYLQL